MYYQEYGKSDLFLGVLLLCSKSFFFLFFFLVMSKSFHIPTHVYVGIKKETIKKKEEKTSTTATL